MTQKDKVKLSGALVILVGAILAIWFYLREPDAPKPTPQASDTSGAVTAPVEAPRGGRGTVLRK